MLVDIDKIMVSNRIRKDFGDIEELAEDIRENGLINPPVVNKDYQLLAGERRLRACKSLGWQQIEVRMMDTRDAEHELNIEISENDVRKGFTKSERVDYIKRLLRIEQAKAKERQVRKSESVRENSHEQTGIRADEVTAEQFGISSNTMRRELFIADNADMLDPADFAEWDEGKLSTNKAYQRIKAAQQKAIQERDDARKVADKLKIERDEAREDAEGYGEEIGVLQKEIRALEAQADKEYENGYKAGERHGSMQAQSQVVTREVVPDDYQEAKKRARELEHLERVHTADNQKLRKQLEEARKELEQAKGILGMNQTMHDVRRDVHYLIGATNQYVRQYGGLTWTVQQLADVDAPTLEELRKAVANLATFSNALATSLEDFTNGR